MQGAIKWGSMECGLAVEYGGLMNVAEDVEIIGEAVETNVLNAAGLF